MILHDDEYTKITFDEDSRIMNNIRKHNPELSDADYKEQSLLLAELVEKHQPQYIIMNSRDMEFTIAPELQKWVNITIFPRLIKAGLKKGAFIVSDDLFTQVSIKQTLEEDQASAFSIKYFDNVEDAKTWLLDE